MRKKLHSALTQHKKIGVAVQRSHKGGVVHFTNVPTSDKYKLFVKELPARIKRNFNTAEYDHIIRKAEETYDVDFSLIKAVIEAESNFDPEAVSKKGAKGLMQILPGNF